MESTEDWLKRIGSKEAKDERVAQRLAGKLNKPVKGGRGLAADVRKMVKKERPDITSHPLACQCDDCVPPWLKEEMKSWPIVTKGMYEARITRKPVTVIRSKSTEPKKPRKNWERRGNSSN